MTETGCKTLNGPRRLSGTTRVGLLAAAICAATPAASQGEEGVFAQFEARCLIPMLDVRDPDLSDLVVVGLTPGLRIFADPESGADWQVIVPRGSTGRQTCSVQGAFGAEVDAWVEAAVASGDSVRLDGAQEQDGAQERLQSTFLREPRLEVRIDRSADDPGLSAIETDLES